MASPQGGSSNRAGGRRPRPEEQVLRVLAAPSLPLPSSDADVT